MNRCAMFRLCIEQLPQDVGSGVDERHEGERCLSVVFREGDLGGGRGGWRGSWENEGGRRTK